MAEFSQSLIAAAAFERDRRAERYPAIIAADPTRADELTIDYQAWCAIAEWLATDRFSGFFGGAHKCGDACSEPCRRAPWISWPEAEQAAEKALASLSAKAHAQESRGLSEHESRKAPQLNDIHARCVALVCIHRAVQLRRQSIDSLNADFRDRRDVHKQPEGIPA